MLGTTGKRCRLDRIIKHVKKGKTSDADEVLLNESKFHQYVQVTVCVDKKLQDLIESSPELQPN